MTILSKLLMPAAMGVMGLSTTRIHLWSGRNYKYVEQNAHIGQLAKVTDVELLHYIMPAALSPSLKVIALEPSFLSFRPFKSFLIYSLPQPLPYQLIITRVEP